MKTHRYFLAIIRDELEALKELAIEQKFMAFLFLTALVLIGFQLKPAPPKKINIAGYTALVESIHAFFEGAGFEVNSIATQGSIQNAELLADPNSGVDAAFIQGGSIDTEMASKIDSLGSIAYEPVWIFYQKSIGKKITNLKELAKLRIGIGPQKGGTKPMAETLFALDDISLDKNPHFVIDSYENNQRDFENGKLDAIIVVTPFVDPSIQQLLRNTNAVLFNFDLAAAYSKKIRYIEQVQMPKGSIDIKNVIPPEDINLIATTTTLAVNKNLNEDLQFLLLLAIKNLNRNPDMLFFSKRDEFPAYMDPTIKASHVALKFYDYGIPETMRYLPLSIAGFANRFWVLIISLATILYALAKLNVHLRVIRYHISHRHGYEELLKIEKSLSLDQPNKNILKSFQAKIEEINQHAISTKVPIGCEADYFQFLHAVEMLREKIGRLNNLATG
jgi:TRAP-type uncharacterized transport system substrate-binding protein